MGFLCRSEIQDGCHRRTYVNIGPYGKMFKYENSEIWGKCQWYNNSKVKLYQKCLLLRNYKSDSIQTTQTCSLDSPLQSLVFFWYEIQDGGYGRTYFNIGPYGKNVSKRKSDWSLTVHECSLDWSSTKFRFSVLI